MRQDHIRVLRRASGKFDCEIVVRESNEASSQYIGRKGYSPKPIWCKAKTADHSQHPAAGLVVDPFKVPEGFLSASLYKAQEEWRNFQTQVLPHRLGFKVRDVPGDRFGCVLHHGNYLYSDYDLMSVIPLESERPCVQKLPPHEGKQLTRRIRTCDYTDHTTDLERQISTYFRQRTGVAMIQHGAEANLPEHEPSPQPCHVFRQEKYRKETRPL